MNKLRPTRGVKRPRDDMDDIDELQRNDEPPAPQHQRLLQYLTRLVRQANTPAMPPMPPATTIQPVNTPDGKRFARDGTPSRCMPGAFEPDSPGLDSPVVHTAPAIIDRKPRVITKATSLKTKNYTKDEMFKDVRRELNLPSHPARPRPFATGGRYRSGDAPYLGVPKKRKKLAPAKVPELSKSTNAIAESRTRPITRIGSEADIGPVILDLTNRLREVGTGRLVEFPTGNVYSLKLISKLENRTQSLQAQIEKNRKQFTPLTPASVPRKELQRKAKSPTPSPSKVDQAVSQKFIRAPSDASFGKVPNLNEVKEQEELASHGRNPIVAEDLMKILRQGKSRDGWLNDNAINAFMHSLAENARKNWEGHIQSKSVARPSAVPRVWAFPTQFYKTMEEPNSYPRVSRWAKRAKFGHTDLLKVHKLIIPVNLANTHWTVVIVYPTKKEIWFFDSMNANNAPLKEEVLVDTNLSIGVVAEYLKHELGTAYVPQEWKFYVGKSAKQRNSSDCGVYACFNALASFYSEHPSKVFTDDSNGVVARRLMAAILMDGGFAKGGDYDLEEFYPQFAV